MSSLSLGSGNETHRRNPSHPSDGVRSRIRAVHKQSPSHRFATLLWDNLPHGGASQVHPHIHGTVHSEHFYGKGKNRSFIENDFSRSGQFESLRYASERYYRDPESMSTHGQRNYFRAIQDIHLAFNLTVSLNGLSVLVPLVSVRAVLDVTPMDSF